MPVDVELNGLLPGRGPGLGAPCLGPGVAPPPPCGVGLAGPGVGTGLAWLAPGRPAGPGTARGPGSLVWPRPTSESPAPGRPCVCSGWLNGTCGTPAGTSRPPSDPAG